MPGSGYSNTDEAAALSAELAHFEAFVDLTPEECAAREGLLSRVTDAVHATLDSRRHASELWAPPPLRVLAFGSLAAGLATYESDVDISVHMADGDEDALRPGVHELRSLAYSLKRSQWARDVEFRAKARVPIVTLVDAITGVAVDVGGAVGRSEGETTTRVVRQMATRWPQLFRPLLLFLKMALAEAELNKPFTGGLGSFKLCMLLAMFLERKTKGASQRRDSGESQLGHYFLAFLRFVAHEFDFTASAVQFMGVRVDFQSVFSWHSVADWATAALHNLQQPVSSPMESRLARLVNAERLAAARARSITLAAAAAALASNAPARGNTITARGGAAAATGPPPVLPPAPAIPASPTSLHVFDLDGTLLSTFGPSDGRAALRSMGIIWPHKSWWSHAASLAPPLPVRPGPALPAYQRAAAQPGAVLALLSGRRRGLEEVIHTALATAGAPHAPHVAFYGPDDDGAAENTLDIKSKAMQALVTRFVTPQLQELHVFEDRAAHAAQLRSICDRLCPATVAWEVHIVGPENGDIASPGPSPLQSARPPLSTAVPPPPTAPQLCCSGGYVRVKVPPPIDLGAVPPLWRVAKEARDGPLDYHITLLNRAETVQYAERLDIAYDADSPGGDSALEARIQSALNAHSDSESSWAHMTFGGVGVVADVAQGSCAAFLTVRDWPAGRSFRASLDLPAQDFHVTLGFIGADVHGVPKNRKSEVRGVDGSGTAALRRAIAERADVLLAGGVSEDFYASDTRSDE